MKLRLLATLGFLLIHVHTQGQFFRVDPGFSVTLDGDVQALAIRPDGRILIGGGFTHVNGEERPHLASISESGTLDESFSVTGESLVNAVTKIVLTPTNVYAMLFRGSGIHRYSTGGTLERQYAMYSSFEPDSLGRVLYGRQTEYLLMDRVGRFNEDGSHDNSFAVKVGCCRNQGVNAVAIQHIDGAEKILIGGNFQSINDTNAIIGLARLNSDGSLDTNFHKFANYPAPVDIKVQTDGTFYVAGNNLLAKHLPDGQLDPDFAVSYGDAWDMVNGIALQSDGSVVMVGMEFPHFTAQPLLRHFSWNGLRDTNFSITLSGLPSVIAIDADDRILVGGAFTNVNCIRRTYLARLIPSDTPDIIDCIPPPPKPEPSLDVTRIRAAKMVCCWPTNYPDYTLQATRRLRPKRPNLEKWVTVTNVPAITDTGSCVTNRIARYGRYYRLVKTN